ncbi:unnamed protein product [Zymoseptoria tritici ST99CH_3D7]|uniref:Amine oxidase domain-containing protein n=1 Tax=Zymoseptoria tritici (strain ST99CH_3D7) TaxID=1276538 RepID=A0A1X7REG5_ZYMT9|nr:unnamed protein product [Zymoseptoria tritici ST99CH_3D7]
MLRAAQRSGRQLNIGIIGAGFAGLRCADVLLQAGCKVTILEARHRVGGRVAQSSHLGSMVDLGPNWIHGSNDNPISKIAKETDTKLHAWDEDTRIYDSQGNVLEQTEANEYNRLLWDDGLISSAFRHANENSASIDPQTSLYDFFVEKSGDLFKEDRKRTTFLQFVKLWGAYIGSPVTRQSLKYFWLEECLEGENPFVAETYHKILNAVARPAEQGADIELNTEVLRVKSERGDSTTGEQPVHVETSRGTTHEFDHVVVTTPLGWLKTNQDRFEPQLPARLAKAIKCISYGSLDKVYVTFPFAFWQSSNQKEDNTSTAGLDPRRTTPNVKATTTPLHQPDSPTSTSSAAGFTIWLQPSYASSTNPNEWLQECMNLAALQPECAQPTLLFYIQGPQSKYIADVVDSATDEQDRDTKLIEHFKPYFSRLPNYDESRVECIPRAVLATCWANDKFSGHGSYSNFQIGLEDGDKHIETMRHGMPERGIWLAGEHTAPFVALGTTTGAYWSGEAVAKRIVEHSLAQSQDF